MLITKFNLLVLLLSMVSTKLFDNYLIVDTWFCLSAHEECVAEHVQNPSNKLDSSLYPILDGEW